jgi:hypothetical protein
MPVINRRGRPLPLTHPFATPRVVFGQRRPLRPDGVPLSPSGAPTLPCKDADGDPTSVKPRTQ